MAKSNYFTTDDIADGIVQTDIEQYSIHKGVHYSLYDIQTMAAATSGFWRIATGSTRTIHFTMDIRTSLNSEVTLYEDSTYTANGTTITAFNNDRSSTNTPDLEVSRTPTFDSAGSYGTAIYGKVIGSDGTNTSGLGGAVIPYNKKFILKQGSNYTLKIDSMTANNRINPSFEWGEY